MASVAICPHCYLQLIVPDDVERDALVECPTCAKEFDLGQAVLRDIPAVVRVERARVAESEAKQVAAEVEAEVEAQVETDVIKDIQARIEAEIAENGLHAGVRELPLSGFPRTQSEPAPDSAEPEEYETAAWFRASETVANAPSAAEQVAQLTKTQAVDNAEEVAEVMDVEHVEDTADIALESMEPKPVEAAEVESMELVAAEAESVGAEDVDVEPAEAQQAGMKPAEPEAIEAESVEAESSAVTLADLLPPERQAEGPEMSPGPSFDLPNVRLTPDNGATIEIDSNMSFGPAAETEFELEGVDFEQMPPDELATVEAANDDEPVFSEPAAATVPTAPFVLPSAPRPRKKRSTVRMLVEVALGGAVSLPLAYFVLLYAKGPESDFLDVAQYLPSAVLPSAFHPTSTKIAEAAVPPTPPIEATEEEPVADDTEGVNVPASYVEEATPAPVSLPTSTAAVDDRYGTTSSPLPLDEPAASPIATASKPFPLSGPTYTIEQLKTALDAGERARSGLVTGDLSDAAVRRTKGMSYAKLCDLAYALVFLDRSSPKEQSDELKQRAQRLFDKIFSDARVRDEVNRIAAIWIDSPHRRHGGVFLSGKLSSGRIAGDVYEYQLTDAQGDTLDLLMQEPLDPLLDGSSHPLGIVGTIVDKPAEQIAGYRGAAARAIWVEDTIPLD